MNVSRPYAILSRSIDADVARVLAGTADAMTGRQVERLVGRGSHRTVQLALGRLAAAGLLDVREYGASKLYTFNREHLAADPVLALLGIRARLLERLSSEIAQWQPAPAHASLFGSAARGDGNEDSDIDLLIVRSDELDAEDERWRAQVEQLRHAVARWTGNRAAISELSEGEVRAMLTDEPPVLAELRQDAIVLAGPRLRDYVRGL
jgi:predicted nucleotidyltransferase